MTEGQESKGVPPMFTDERVLAWMEEHLTELRQSVSGQRILYPSELPANGLWPKARRRVANTPKL